MIFKEVFSPSCIIVNLESREKDELFEELGQCIFSAHPEIDREKALASLWEREAKMSTGIMKGVGIPHGTCKSVKKCAGAIGISRGGIDYDSLDGNPVKVVFMLLFGEDDNTLHLEVLKSLSQVLQDESFVDELYKKQNPQDVFDFLCSREN